MQMERTQRYLMYFSYIGSSFRGSQIQKGTNISTVQLFLEDGLKAFFKLTGERPIRVFLLSRTDKGVHALRTVFHVDLPPLKSKFLEPSHLKAGLNKYFSETDKVRIVDVYKVPDSFSVTKYCTDKTYLYRIGLPKEEFFIDSKFSCVPIMENNRTFFMCFRNTFDFEKVRESCHLFEGEKDYGGILGKPLHNVKPTICNIMEYKIKEAEPLVKFDPLAERYNFFHFICRGNRFLYCMIRRMVSLSIALGFGKIGICDIQKLFNEPIPSSWPNKANYIVPGYGLYLVNVNIDLAKLDQKEKVLDSKSDEILFVNEN